MYPHMTNGTKQLVRECNHAEFQPGFKRSVTWLAYFIVLYNRQVTLHFVPLETWR